MKKFLLLFMLSITFIYPNIARGKNYNIDKKYVALSFDDGPSNYTDDIVDLLYNYNSTATFFILGNKALQFSNTLNNIISKGNEIANHTYSHPWLTHLNSEEILKEIEDTQKIIFDITGYTPSLFRPSYGDINKKLKEIIKLRTVFWTNDSRDWKYHSSKTIASNVIRNIKENDIILMHDTHKKTIDALKIIIPKLQELGYEIVSVTELLEIKELRELYRY